MEIFLRWGNYSMQKHTKTKGSGGMLPQEITTSETATGGFRDHTHFFVNTTSNI